MLTCSPTKYMKNEEPWNHFISAPQWKQFLLAHTLHQFCSTALLQLVVEWVSLSVAGAKQAMVLHLCL